MYNYSDPILKEYTKIVEAAWVDPNNMPSRQRSLDTIRAAQDKIKNMSKKELSQKLLNIADSIPGAPESAAEQIRDLAVNLDTDEGFGNDPTRQLMEPVDPTEQDDIQAIDKVQ